MKKGCVYFIKQVGLSPIKIGFSDTDTPLRRFNHLCTYFPYGGELIGYITNEDAFDLESRIHKDLKKYRLAGEWFDVPVDELFMLTSAITGFTKCNIVKVNACKSNGETENKLAFIELYNKNRNAKKTEIAKELNISRRAVYDFIAKIEKESAISTLH